MLGNTSVNFTLNGSSIHMATSPPTVLLLACKKLLGRALSVDGISSVFAISADQSAGLKSRAENVYHIPLGMSNLWFTYSVCP